MQMQINRPEVTTAGNARGRCQNPGEFNRVCGFVLSSSTCTIKHHPWFTPDLKNSLMQIIKLVWLQKTDFTQIELVVRTLVNGVPPIIDDFCTKTFQCSDWNEPAINRKIKSGHLVSQTFAWMAVSKNIRLSPLHSSLVNKRKNRRIIFICMWW